MKSRADKYALAAQRGELSIKIGAQASIEIKEAAKRRNQAIVLDMGDGSSVQVDPEGEVTIHLPDMDVIAESYERYEQPMPKGVLLPYGHEAEPEEMLAERGVIL